MSHPNPRYILVTQSRDTKVVKFLQSHLIIIGSNLMKEG